MGQAFSIKEVLGWGWVQFKAHNGILLQATLTVIALNILSALLRFMFSTTILAPIFSIIFTIIGLFVGVGYKLITLRLARGEAVSYRNIFPPYKMVGRYFLASLLIGLLILGLVLVAIVVGFGVVLIVSLAHIDLLTGLVAAALLVGGMVGLMYISLRYCLVAFAVIDGAHIMESIHKSAVLTHGVKWKIFWFSMLAGLINILGALCILVGLLVTIPLTAMALAKIYVLLKARVEEKA